MSQAQPSKKTSTQLQYNCESLGKWPANAAPDNRKFAAPVKASGVCVLGYNHAGCCMTADRIVAAQADGQMSAMLLRKIPEAKLRQIGQLLGQSRLHIKIKDAASTVVSTPSAPRRLSLAPFYERLGLRMGATELEVRIRYRRESLKCHPDKYDGADAVERFIALKEAADAILKGPVGDAHEALEKRTLENQSVVSVCAPYSEECSGSPAKRIYLLLLQIIGDDEIAWGDCGWWRHPDGKRWLLKVAEDIARVRYTGRAAGSIGAPADARAIAALKPLTVRTMLVRGGVEGARPDTRAHDSNWVAFASALGLDPESTTLLDDAASAFLAGDDKETIEGEYRLRQRGLNAARKRKREEDARAELSSEIDAMTPWVTPLDRRGQYTTNGWDMMCSSR